MSRNSSPRFVTIATAGLNMTSNTAKALNKTECMMKKMEAKHLKVSLGTKFLGRTVQINAKHVGKTTNHSGNFYRQTGVLSIP